MNCGELDSFVSPYLDGEFEPEARLEVEQHLVDCAACSSRVHQEARFRELLRSKLRDASSSVAGRAPEALRARVLAGFQAERRKSARARWAQMGAAAAAVALVAGSGVYLMRVRDRDRLVHYAVWNHRKALPLDIRDVPTGSMGAWVAEKLDQRLPVPRLPNAVVRGVRLSNVSDKPAAYISYDASDAAGEPKRIGLFVLDDSKEEVPADPLPAIQMANSQGYNVAVWRDKEILYVMTTDLDEHDIRQVLAARTGPELRGAEPLGEALGARSVAYESLAPAAYNFSPAQPASFQPVYQQ